LRAQGYDVGEQQYKRVPAGYAADHERAELLKHGALWVATTFLPPPEELHSSALVDLCLTQYRAIRSIPDFLLGLTSARGARAAPPR
jgi:hypothetical protein